MSEEHDDRKQHGYGARGYGGLWTGYWGANGGCGNCGHYDVSGTFSASCPGCGSLAGPAGGSGGGEASGGDGGGAGI